MTTENLEQVPTSPPSLFVMEPVNEETVIKHVQLVDRMGNDLRIANVARVSMDAWKEEYEGRLPDAKDKRLIQYLWEHQHTSPFRHAMVTLRVTCPIFVARQWVKHQVGCSWNEMSMRYVAPSTRMYFIPSEYRLQHRTSKQCSSKDNLSPKAIVGAEHAWIQAIQTADNCYQDMIDSGVARELARAVLPVGLYTSFVWTASLHALLHFFSLRIASDAQPEFRQYAIQVFELTRNIFPESIKAAAESGDWYNLIPLTPV